MKKAEALLWYGSCIDEKDNALAIAGLITLLKQCPLDLALSKLAFLYQKSGQPDTALPLHRKYHRLNPQDRWSLHNYADCCMMLGLRDTAKALYHEYLGLEPRNPHICEDLARLYLENEDYGAAIHYAKLATKTNRGLQGTGYSILMQAYLATGNTQEVIKLKGIARSSHTNLRKTLTKIR